MPLPPLRRLLTPVLAVPLLLAVPAAFAQIPPPAPRLISPQASQPLQLQRVDVQATLAGSQADTRIELVVRNPNPRVLEATLEFPLAEGQGVTGFALDINGELVSAVPVPKDKGRQVFEDVIRRRVDPALLERTAGNSFKLRIYPLPAGGERRVLLQIGETLRPDAQGLWHYRLPLDFGQPIAQFDGRFSLRGGTLPLGNGEGLLAGAERTTAGNESTLRLQRRDWQPREVLDLAWQAPASEESVVVQSHAGASYAYAEVAVDAAPGPARLPKLLHLVWDASGSGAQRDHAREFALLDALFAAAPDLRVRLTVARDAAEPAKTFTVRGGDWSALRRTLETLPYDGATSTAAWRAGFGPATPDALTLLFTDGLANWEREPRAGAPHSRAIAPVYAVIAATRHDAARLRRLADDSGGRLVDLSRLDTRAALYALTRPTARLLSLAADGADQLVAASRQAEDGRFLVAARLTAPEGRLKLVTLDAQGRRSEHRLDLVAPNPSAHADAAIPLAARRWAELRVAELEADRPLHRAEIRRLGEQFRLVSSETSLIVLDNLADYVRHEIEPPTAAMREAYRLQLRDRAAERGREREAHLEDLVKRFDERQAWWARTFKRLPPGKPSPDEPPPPFIPPPEFQIPAPVAEMAMPSMSTARPSIAAPAAAEPAPRTEVAVTGVRAQPRTAADGQPARIELQSWQPDAAYARRLREARNADRYAIYLDERAGHADSTAFFIDAAEVFFAKGQKALALRVLSNLAKMALENRDLLRILAYRLLQADEVALAVPLLARVRELAPDEPQSSRDLGLALARAQQPQRAVDLLWDVASGAWDGRFPDVDLIALGELNAIAARHRGLDLSRVDRRLRRNLPLDLRVVLTWDADNTDIDLWVTDPDGEKAFFANPLTRMGGAMTRDFIGGYGPEAFSLRRARPGRYEVRAQFYGHNQQLLSPHTTLMLWLSTGFGTAAQKDRHVVLRLSGRGDDVLVGSFRVGP